MRAVIAICIMATACVAQDTTTKSFDILYHYDDLPSSQAFVLKFRNEYKKRICLTPADWPNSAGRLDRDHSTVWVDIEGKRFGIRPFNTGYCPKCATKVEPKEGIDGKISYEDFSIPPSLYSAMKSLHFQPKGFYCK